MLNSFREVYLPYCIKEQPDGKFVVLNREYKPLGFKTKEYVEFSDYPICVKFDKLKPIAIKAKLDLRTDSEGHQSIYLYNDSTNPSLSSKNMKEYLDKLAILAKLQIVL